MHMNNVRKVGVNLCSLAVYERLLPMSAIQFNMNQGGQYPIHHFDAEAAAG